MREMNLEIEENGGDEREVLCVPNEREIRKGIQSGRKGVAREWKREEGWGGGRKGGRETSCLYIHIQVYFRMCVFVCVCVHVCVYTLCALHRSPVKTVGPRSICVAVIPIKSISRHRRDKSFSDSLAHARRVTRAETRA